LDLDYKIERMVGPEGEEFSGQYKNTHAQFILDMGGVINAMLRYPSPLSFASCLSFACLSRHAPALRFSILTTALLRRWPSGTFFIPYPMTSHLPPVGLVRDILKSGATQVLNVSMYLEGDAKDSDSQYFAGEIR
jgi:hypothetical protein